MISQAHGAQQPSELAAANARFDDLVAGGEADEAHQAGDQSVRNAQTDAVVDGGDLVERRLVVPSAAGFHRVSPTFLGIPILNMERFLGVDHRLVRPDVLTDRTCGVCSATSVTAW
ncbi:hypothetical protein ACWCPF_37580 [Streptomyces sp. NPDC001858]